MATPNPEFSPDELAELLSAHMPDIAGYRVMRRLGQGGMSYVYLGLQESLDRQVAIKIIDPIALKDEISKLRFEREARTIAKLQHPSIVAIYEVGRSDLGLLYYVMPYLPRGHLGQRDLREDEPGLIAILRAMLWALDYAHERGIVHRDLKPENVLFDNVDRPLLTDFGIAMHRADRRRVTGGGFALGSSTHMAPEQARGEKVDGRADLYAIGVLTFELLTGALPFQADDPLSLAVKHAVDPVPRLPAAKAHWQPFIDRALAKTAEARYASAREMGAALDRLEQERRATPAAAAAAVAVVAAPNPTAQAPLPRTWFLGRPRFLAVAGALVLLLAVLVAVLAWRAQPALAPAAPSVTAAPTTANSTPPLPAAAAPAAEQAEPAPAAAVESASTKLTEAAADLAEGSAASASEEPSAADAEAEAEALAAEAALPADERALRAAARQIPRLRLTLPAGDNALESLLEAQANAADPARLRPLGEAWLSALHPYVARGFAGSPASPDRRLYDAAARLATALHLQRSAAWRATEQLPIDWLRGRLQAALNDRDLASLRAAKAAAASFGIDATRLEPEWSQPLVLARVGDRLPGPTALQLLQLPQGARPGLAATASVISRGDYARFVNATQRAATPCRVRTALMTLRKRSWSAPGFAQDDRHPVVCVNLADAEAYAAWLSARDGQRYRLPTAAEWAALFAVNARPEACDQAGQVCGREGTLSMILTAGALLPSQGNVREWTARCGDGCRRQPVSGFGWRDAERAAVAGPAEVAAEVGYDDVGFRLLREVAADEVEMR